MKTHLCSKYIATVKTSYKIRVKTFKKKKKKMEELDLLAVGMAETSAATISDLWT